MPPPWTEEELDAARAEAIKIFRKRRTEEPVEDYIEAFDKYQGVLEELLETTVDLTVDAATMVGVVSEPKLLEAFRYLSGPARSRSAVLYRRTRPPTRNASMTRTRNGRTPLLRGRAPRIRILLPQVKMGYRSC